MGSHTLGGGALVYASVSSSSSSSSLSSGLRRRGTRRGVGPRFLAASGVDKDFSEDDDDVRAVGRVVDDDCGRLTRARRAAAPRAEGFASAGVSESALESSIMP